MTDTHSIIGTRIPLLDQGWVELLDFMPHPLTSVPGDLAIVNAARVSFLGESKGEDADKKLLLYLMREKHTSPFEMAVFKMRLHAPLVCLWQLVRHRTASLNLSSGRYVEFKEDEFYVPDVWRKQSPSNKQASLGEMSFEDGQVLTMKLVEHYERGYRLYEEALATGVAREQARLFLSGFGVYYSCILKMDAHNLMHFMKLRMAPDAQHEIRVYANAIYEHFFKPLLPWTAEAFEKYQLTKEEQAMTSDNPTDPLLGVDPKTIDDTRLSIAYSAYQQAHDAHDFGGMARAVEDIQDREKEMDRERRDRLQREADERENRLKRARRGY